MKDEKQTIEEMAKDVAHSISWCDDVIPTVDCLGTAAALYGIGYRRQEWMPVSEPPKENGIYCVMVEHHKSRKYKQRTHARYKNGRWVDLYDNWENRCWDVTHWMPLPEPPKMKGGE